MLRSSSSSLVLASLIAITVTVPSAVQADYQLYTTFTTTTGSATTSATAATSSSTQPVFDTTVLTAPSVPAGLPTEITWSFPPDATSAAADLWTLSGDVSGDFLGFSVELSSFTNVVAVSSGDLKVPFLNYLNNLYERTGIAPAVRIGGSSQEGSLLYVNQQLDSSAMLEKVGSASSPTVDYTTELFTTLNEINAQWLIGLSFSDPNNVTNQAEITTNAKSILGSKLIGLQLGQDPDLYSSQGRRNGTWDIPTWTSQVQTAVAAMSGISGSLVIPSTQGSWTPDQMIASGLLSTFGSEMKAVSFTQYPTFACDGSVSAQTVFSDYLNHSLATSLIAPYTQAVQNITSSSLPTYMTETNTLSCSGLGQGLADSFGATMFIADWALQLASSGFSNAFLHVGGSSAYYNPFTPPAYNVSLEFGKGTQQWTTGSTYYSALLVAEVFGKSNVSQIVDMTSINSTSTQYTPMYAVYENGAPTKLVLFNYVSDSTGASNYNAILNGWTTAPSNVYVRYLRAPSVSEQYNITWAGQTLGTSWASDGTMKGTNTTVTITCNTDQNLCSVPVYAPSIAIVYLTSDALSESTASNTEIYTTTTTGAGVASATTGGASVNPSVLATSNGRGGIGSLGGSSSSGSTSDATRNAVVYGSTAIAVGVMFGFHLLFNGRA